ncbi:hypothetical protein [Leeuwenhoekiella nanhaiensis]|nr:hypothetical protein [Leeuwenhoekiella nanhaiensis]
MSKLKVGDPTRDASDLGPMSREDLRDQLHEQVFLVKLFSGVCHSIYLI